MKSTNKTANSAQQSNINFRALFTGETYVTPVAFNPSAEDLRKIKNVREDFEIKEPEYNKVIKGEDYHIISLLCKFNPNETLKLKTQAYANEVFINYNLYISNRPVMGANSGKTQIIDCHNQNAWIKLEGKAKLADQIKAAQQHDSPYKDGDPLRKINSDTARIAKQGEVALYDLVFKMSTLDKHNIKEDEPTKSTRLDDFRLGENAEKTFENLTKGDYTALNMLLASNSQDFEGKEHFVKGNENNKIGVLLGVRPNQEGDKIYQDVFTPFTVFSVVPETIYRSTDREWDYTDTVYKGKKLGKSRLNKKAVESLTSPTYPWTSYWSNSFKFQEVTVDDLPKNNTKVDGPAPKIEQSDDLPF
jgi:hypothetical protein